MKRKVLTAFWLLDYVRGLLTPEEMVAIEEFIETDAQAVEYMRFLQKLKQKGDLTLFLQSQGITSPERLTQKGDSFVNFDPVSAEDLTNYVLGNMQDDEKIALENHLIDDPQALKQVHFLKKLQSEGKLDAFFRALNGTAQETYYHTNSRAATVSPFLIQLRKWAPMAASIFVVFLILWIIWHYTDIENRLRLQLRGQSGESQAELAYKVYLDTARNPSPEEKIAVLQYIASQLPQYQLAPYLEAELMECQYTNQDFSPEENGWQIGVHDQLFAVSQLSASPQKAVEGNFTYFLFLKNDVLQLQGTDSTAIWELKDIKVAMAGFSSQLNEIIVFDQQGNLYLIKTPKGLLNSRQYCLVSYCKPA